MRRLAVMAALAGAAGLVVVSAASLRVVNPNARSAALAIRVEPLTLPEGLRQAVLGRGETLVGLLGRLGVGSVEAHEWAAEARRLLDLRALPVGLVAVARSDVHGSLRAVRLQPDWASEVVLERTPAGIRGRRLARPVERQEVVIVGEVRSSLFEAVGAAGESDALALALADIFQWDIDFHREVQPGDRFAVLVERVRAEGQTVSYGPVLAATYRTQGRSLSAVRWTVDGVTGYWDDRGRPLRKQFLRAPLKLSRVTSRFSSSRLHPVLGRRLPHWGVDYAAPEGTPVMVTADGVVHFTGWKGGGGNTVEVGHPGGYTTAYLHLSRFAPGLAPGQRVSQGQVIGYVGSTGLATGPHVDYRVTRHGRYLNPLSLGKDPAPPLREADLPRFRAHAAGLLTRLEAPEPGVGQGLASLPAAVPHGG